MRPFDDKNFEIVLRLADQRGHKIRAAQCRDLKIKVWTQDPYRYLTFHLRDIHQGEHEDVLVVPKYEMAMLDPGVVVYKYEFRQHHEEIGKMVVTDQKWCRPSDHIKPNDPKPGRPGDPLNFHVLEHLKERIEELDRQLSLKISDLSKVFNKEYPEKLEAETDRAIKAETKLKKSCADLQRAIINEGKRAKGVEGNLNKTLQDLAKSLEDFKNTYTQDTAANESAQKEKEEANLQALQSLRESISDAKKQVTASLDSLNKKIEGVSEDLLEFKKEVKRKSNGFTEDIDNLSTRISRNATAINDNADDIAKVRRSISDASSAMEIEANRAKASEEILSTKINDNKLRIDNEAARAKAVEKDITDALLRLKNNVANSSDSVSADIVALRIELSDKIEYRIKEIVGAAPEALDTLEEIAAKLKEDDDAIRVLDSILAGKVNVEDIYKKEKIDSLLLEIKNLITAEIQRAKLAEKQNADAIEILNGDESTVGSLKHLEADCNHYTDDSIKKHEREQEEKAKTFREEIRDLLNGKQEIGDYVKYIQEESGRKHVILPNDCNIVGTTPDGADGRNLIMLSKYGVVDIGSANSPINLNGSNKRPTFNDTEEIALMKDVEDSYENLPEFTEEEIREALNLGKE